MKHTSLITLSVVVAAAMLVPEPARAQTCQDGRLIDNIGMFGASLDVEDGIVYAGEPLNSLLGGVVYGYDSANDWAEVSRVSSPDPENGGGFGCSLDVHGSMMLVGAFMEEGGAGGAYLLEKSGEQWSIVTRLSADVAPGTEFGSTVALGDGYAAVGAHKLGDRGSVFVYVRDEAGNWPLMHTLSPEEGLGESFGKALKAHAGALVVGAPGGTGAVYVFGRDDTGWHQEQVLTRPDAIDSPGFGASLAANGDMMLVGAPRLPQRGGPVGRVYEYALQNERWQPMSVVQAFDPGPASLFGLSVAYVADGIIVGAPGADRTGVIYHFERSEDGNSWSDVEKMVPGDALPGDQVGWAAASTGDVAAVTASMADFRAGVVYASRFDGSVYAQPRRLASERQNLASVTGAQVDCDKGKANVFECSNVDLISFIPKDQIGAGRGVHLSDVWGWTDPESGREYAIVGRADGTSFVDVTDPFMPKYLGDLPKTEGSIGNIWRDVKVYRDHAYIVADNAGDHGIQIFDLRQLRDVADPPAAFTETAHYDGISSSHNIVINEDTGFAYAVGSSGGGETCGGGLHMINIQNPTQPMFAGCFADPSTGRSGTGYSHDAQCVVYRGPDSDYSGHEICFGANETALSIADVTDKSAPKALSTAAYPTSGYIHQGWLTEDQRYFMLNDETDEISSTVSHTRTLIFDVTDLDDPQLVREFLHDSQASDHNLYVRGNVMYQSNYKAGLRLVDVTDPVNPVEVGYFDTMPYGTNGPGFAGTWSNYPFFKSGMVVVTSFHEGLFIVKKQEVDI